MPVPFRVLVAEDNPLNRELALRFLAFLGHDGRGVCDGREALKALAGGSYDLVLMDCEMPGVDGFEATRRLRQRGDEVPVIAFTALAPSVARRRCVAVGMNDFLAKPFELSELSAILSRWLPATSCRTESG